MLFTVKNYSIQRSVEYKVLESNHMKYHGKFKYFGNGCNWSIHVAHHQRKEQWEIWKYNTTHTCLSTSLSQDHPQLNTNVICATIFPMVQVDPRRGTALKLRIEKYGLPSKKPLLRFMAIRKNCTMSFQDGCKLYRCLCQVQSSNWVLSCTIVEILLIGAVWCSTICVRYFSPA